MFAVAWGGNEFTPLLVMYRQQGLSAAAVDLLLFAYVIGIIPALLVGGPLSDRYGRRALMLPAPFIGMAGSLVLAFGAGGFPLLFAGRVLSGVALGLAMAVGSSWVKELSDRPFDDTPDGTGARRGAMSLTAGFSLGAAVAGALAQWAPWPTHLAFLFDVALTVPGALLQLHAPEPGVERSAGRLVDDLRVPGVRQKDFRERVLPVAPWVFSAGAAAYAVLPTLIAPKLAGQRIAFSALCCLVCLGCGLGAQAVARRIPQERAGVVALTLVVVGMALAALASGVLTVPVVLAAALVLGAGYGTALVAGLSEIGRIAAPTDLAGLTAVFYAVTYLGFGIPVVLTVLDEASPALTYPIMFGALAVLALCCLCVVWAASRGRTPPTADKADLESSIRH
ncbi:MULTISPECIES: MFS transporter [unclassified Tsukamurella]|uniref:MFS transporter n=1 Tax=unclassified Tsukamurella TaxID=2633480 RepID=UPI0031BAE2F1